MTMFCCICNSNILIIRASVDILYRDSKGQISCDLHIKQHQTRRKRLAKPSKLTKSQGISLSVISVVHGPSAMAAIKYHLLIIY